MGTPSPPPLVPEMLADFEAESTDAPEEEALVEDPAFGSPVVPDR